MSVHFWLTIWVSKHCKTSKVERLQKAPSYVVWEDSEYANV